MTETCEHPTGEIRTLVGEQIRIQCDECRAEVMVDGRARWDPTTKVLRGLRPRSPKP